MEFSTWKTLRMYPLNQLPKLHGSTALTINSNKVEEVGAEVETGSTWVQLRKGRGVAS